MKILVYGAAGFIGKHLCRIILAAKDEVVYGQRVVCLDNVHQDLQKHQPDRVVCCIGRTHGPGMNSSDYLEGRLLDNISCNLTAPLLIAQATAVGGKNGPVALLYIGTGCILEYDRQHPPAGPAFTEEDQANFFGSSYSIVKGQTELLMKALKHVICARIRWPIADEDDPREFITKFVTYQRILSVPNSMTVLSDILPFLLACLQDKKSGIINAVNPGLITHAQILRMHRNIRDPNHSFALMTAEEQSRILIAGRANNHLSSLKAHRWLAELTHITKIKYALPDQFPDIKKRVKDILISRKISLSPDHQSRRKGNGQISDSLIMQMPIRVPTLPKGKIMLVNGGSGFIESNFIHFWMKEHPQDIIIKFDCLEWHSNLKNVEIFGRTNYILVESALWEMGCLQSLFERCRLSDVVNFASASNVDQSLIEPVGLTISNLAGIFTDEVYRKVKTEDCTEDESQFWLTNPDSTKADAECLVMANGKSFKIAWTKTRANNVDARSEYPLQVIPKFITCLLKKQKMSIEDNGQSSRKLFHKCTAIQRKTSLFGEGP